MKMYFFFAQHYAFNAMNNILYETYYRLLMDERPWPWLKEDVKDADYVCTCTLYRTNCLLQFPTAWAK